MSKKVPPKGTEPWGSENRVLPVNLTTEEIRVAGKDLADGMVRIIHLEEKLAGVSANIKGEMKELAAEGRRLARTIASGTELRSVACSVFRRLDTGMHQVVRDDTGELIYERGLNEEEKNALKKQALPSVEAVQ